VSCISLHVAIQLMQMKPLLPQALSLKPGVSVPHHPITAQHRGSTSQSVTPALSGVHALNVLLSLSAYLPTPLLLSLLVHLLVHSPTCLGTLYIAFRVC